MKHKIKLTRCRWKCSSSFVEDGRPMIKIGLGCCPIEAYMNWLKMDN